MEVILTLTFRFGDTPAESVTLLSERRIPLTGSVLQHRDRIAREFLRLLFKAGATQPRVISRLFGGAR